MVSKHDKESRLCICLYVFCHIGLHSRIEKCIFNINGNSFTYFGRKPLHNFQNYSGERWIVIYFLFLLDLLDKSYVSFHLILMSFYFFNSRPIRWKKVPEHLKSVLDFFWLFSYELCFLLSSSSSSSLCGNLC